MMILPFFKEGSLFRKCECSIAEYMVFIYFIYYFAAHFLGTCHMFGGKSLLSYPTNNCTELEKNRKIIYFELVFYFRPLVHTISFL